MGRFFVAGLSNIETTLGVEGFPLDYFPVRYLQFGIESSVSGVGYNIAKALTCLGNRVDFASLIGGDANGRLVRDALAEVKISDELVIVGMTTTAQSVILYEPGGRRQIHVDLKDIQVRQYPAASAVKHLQACDLAVVCNINFARPFLALAQAAGKWIATDVHALSDLSDEYNQDFMRQADILFLSDDALSDPPEAVAQALMGRFKADIVVIGLGSQGALMAVRRDDFLGRFKARPLRPVVNTIGAGDALFSAFIHQYIKTKDPYRAIQAGIAFAGYKIGEKGAAAGFLTAEALDEWLAVGETEEA